MNKLTKALLAAKDNAKGWKTTLIGVALCVLGGIQVYQGNTEAGWGLLGTGALLVVGVADAEPKAGE